MALIRDQILVDHRSELLEQVLAIMRAGGGFRVILNAEGRMLFVSQSGNGVVIQVNVRDI